MDMKVVESGLKGNKVDNVDNFVDNMISRNKCTFKVYQGRRCF